MRLGGWTRIAIAVLAGWLLVRVLGAPWEGGFPTSFPDSAWYLDAAQQGPLSSELWWGERPPTYPLVLWALGSDPTRVAAVQAVVHVVCWVWLGTVLVRRLRHRSVAVVACVVLVGVAISARTALWIPLVLTESLSLSLSVAAVAAWLSYEERPTLAWGSIAAAVTAAWMLLRDSNAAAAVGVLVVACGVAGAFAWRRRSDVALRTAGLLGALLVVGFVSVAAVSAAGRTEVTIHNNVGLRWLPDEGMTDFLADRGMPLDEALRARTGSDAWADGEAFLRDPALADYREWAADEGRRALVESLLLRPAWWFDRFSDDLPAVLASSYRGYDVFAVSDRVPADPLGPLDPVGSSWAVASTAIASAVAATWLVVRRRTLGLVVAALVASAWADLTISYVGDAVEVGRHLVVPLVRLAVAATVAVAFAVDEWWSRMEPPRAADPAGRPAAGDDARSAEHVGTDAATSPSGIAPGIEGRDTAPSPTGDRP